MSTPSSSSTSASSSAIVFPVITDQDLIVSTFTQDSTEYTFELPLGAASRGERIGRIADWTGMAADAAQQRGGPSAGRRHQQQMNSAITNTHQKAEEEAEGWSFSLASNLPSLPSSRRPMASAASKTARPGPAGAPQTGGRFGQKSGYGPRRYGGWNNRPVERNREASIKVGQDWSLVQEIEFSRLAKLQINIEEPAILATTGKASIYDRSFDKLKAKAEKTFTGMAETVPAHLPASQDAFLLASHAKGEATIYTTDAVVSTLMSCQRTVQPWDLLVKRRGQAVFLDARPGSKIHLVNVNESAGDDAPEDSNETMNGQSALALEASRINAGLPAFLGKPDASSTDEAAVRYAKFTLGEGFSMLVRAQVSNALSPDSDDMILAKAFLEHDHSTFGWRQKLDTSRGAVIAHEMKHNGAMLARWIYQAICANCPSLRLAYISRSSPKNPAKHAILGVHDFDPLDLATQMNLNVANGFAVVRAIADLCLAQPDNTDYALVRDPNKPMLRLYALPSS